MRIDQLVLALVRPAHQTAPGSVQLAAFVLDVLHSLWVGLDQTLGCLPERVDLSREGAPSVRSTAPSERGRATRLLGPCLLERPGLSRSPRACAAAPARWPGRGHSCPCSEPGSSLLSILLFHQHLCGHKRKKNVFKRSKGVHFLDRNSASCSGPSPSDATHTCGSAAPRGHCPACGCVLLRAAAGSASGCSAPAETSH